MVSIAALLIFVFALRVIVGRPAFFHSQLTALFSTAKKSGVGEMGDNEDTTKEVSMLFKRSRTEKSICDVDQLILSPTRIIFPVFSNLASVCYRIRPASESPLLSDLLASIFKPPRV